jgi:hypothetical protein
VSSPEEEARYFAKHSDFAAGHCCCDGSLDVGCS